jgi:hypothetical protein
MRLVEERDGTELLHHIFSEWNDFIPCLKGRTESVSFFIWLKSKNRMEPLHPLFDWRAKRM